MPDIDLLYLFRLMANRPKKLRLLLQQYGDAAEVWERACDEALKPFDLGRFWTALVVT